MSIDYREIKDLSQEEITKKIGLEELAPPPKGLERDKFFRFVSLSSDEREKFISDLEATPQAPETSEEPKEELKDDAVELEPVKEEVEPEPYVIKELGFSDLSELAESVKAMRKAQDGQKRLIDKYNAERGTWGNRNKKLEEENKRMAEELELIKKSAKKQEPTERPVRPDPNSFQDGIYDDAYEAAVKEYDQKIDSWAQTVRSPDNSEIERLKAEIEKLKSVTIESKQTEEQRTRSAAWEGFWSEDIPGFQDKFGLKTSAPIKTISDHYAIIEDGNTTQEQKDYARQYINSLPARDRMNYAKVSKAVERMYQFSDVPRRKYNKWETMIADNDLTKEYNKTNDVPLTKDEERELSEQQLQQEMTTATVPDAHRMGSNDGKMNENLVGDDVIKRFTDLNNEYGQAVDSGRLASENWLRSPKAKEYISLRRKMGLSVPDYMRKAVAV